MQMGTLAGVSKTMRPLETQCKFSISPSIDGTHIYRRSVDVNILSCNVCFKILRVCTNIGLLVKLTFFEVGEKIGSLKTECVSIYCSSLISKTHIDWRSLAVTLLCCKKRFKNLRFCGYQGFLAKVKPLEVIENIGSLKNKESSFFVFYRWITHLLERHRCKSSKLQRMLQKSTRVYQQVLSSERNIPWS